MADENLKASELERFARNLENFAKTNPGEEMYYRKRLPKSPCVIQAGTH
ncbi:hypothetical protein PAERUG_P40_Scotland_4_VIM_2_09_12_04144 [Pseudomonas aeruginosa]|nr:hypothetical protein [Pseudomonas aeruginosa]CRN68137.1 hypothetical protein PAERUG_P40_Scotland_4_VIM_2_09_12_04144 [Pseudomonas aeruginosa]